MIKDVLKPPERTWFPFLKWTRYFILDNVTGYFHAFTEEFGESQSFGWFCCGLLWGYNGYLHIMITTVSMYDILKQSVVTWHEYYLWSLLVSWLICLVVSCLLACVRAVCCCLLCLVAGCGLLPDWRAAVASRGTARRHGFPWLQVRNLGLSVDMFSGKPVGPTYRKLEI